MSRVTFREIDDYVKNLTFAPGWEMRAWQSKNESTCPALPKTVARTARGS